jgi:hypothetical protein
MSGNKVAVVATKRKATDDAADTTAKQSSTTKKKKTTDGSHNTLSFPGKITKQLTIAQLTREAQARGLDLGNVKHDKTFLLNLLGDGSVSVIAVKNKAAKEESETTKTKK